MELAWPVLLVVMVLAGALLFTPYEAVLEGVIAVVMVTAVDGRPEENLLS